VRINFVFPNIDNVAFAHGLKVVGSNLFKMSFLQRLSPDLEEFRLGVQKCRKTIRDGVKNELVSISSTF